MDLQAIVVDGRNGEEGRAKANERGGSSSTEKQTITHEIHQAPIEGTLAMGGGTHQPVENHIASQGGDPNLLESLTAIMERRLERRPVPTSKERSCPPIFRFPSRLAGIHQKAQFPELVSIGPYHRGKPDLLEFEEYKMFYLREFLYRGKSSSRERDMKFYLQKIIGLEAPTRKAYDEEPLLSSEDFVQMMLLDGCFVVELLRNLDPSQTEDHINHEDPILTRPWLIPSIIADLLKLENQLPFFVLQSLFSWSSPEAGTRVECCDLPRLALLVFDMVFPRPSETIKECRIQYGQHLLDFFRRSLLPFIPLKRIVKQNQSRIKRMVKQNRFRPSAQSVQSVTQLKPSGVAFRAEKSASSLLNIKFYKSYKPLDFGKWVLQIPAIHVNDSMSVLLINCIAMEQCFEHCSKHFTDYVSFMGHLINQPRDVTLLCSNGIMTCFPRGDKFVADLFNNLKENVDFNISDSYLSKEMADMEAYYCSHWATMMRTYFSSPWSLVSIYYASFLLLLTFFQSFMAGLSYWK